MNLSRLTFAFVFGVALSFSAAITAKAASITYTYTGNNFTYAIAPYTTGNKITGSFTIGIPLGNNLNTFVSPLAFSFTDGIDTITDSNSDILTDVFFFATDAAGSITNWGVVVNLNTTGNNSIQIAFFLPNANGGSTVDYVNAIGGNTALQNGITLAANVNSPGTWSAAPEPSTSFLMVTALLALGVVSRNSMRKYPS